MLPESTMTEHGSAISRLTRSGPPFALTKDDGSSVLISNLKTIVGASAADVVKDRIGAGGAGAAFQASTQPWSTFAVLAAHQEITKELNQVSRMAQINASPIISEASNVSYRLGSAGTHQPDAYLQ